MYFWNIVKFISRQEFICRFLHPVIYGDYPKSMVKMVGDRLPQFTTEQSFSLKGSIDFVGINHYTTYYARDSKLAILEELLEDNPDAQVLTPCESF